MFTSCCLRSLTVAEWSRAVPVASSPCTLHCTILVSTILPAITAPKAAIRLMRSLGEPQKLTSQYAFSNGLLRLPMPESPDEAEKAFDVWKSHLHKMKCLVAAGVPACGLTLDRKSFAGEVDKVHKVGVVYTGAANLGCSSILARLHPTSLLLPYILGKGHIQRQSLLQAAGYQRRPHTRLHRSVEKLGLILWLRLLDIFVMFGLLLVDRDRQTPIK